MIFLVGYRGTGKTTVAGLLAEKLGWPWIDADSLLEQAQGKTIREIFATEGEESFRDREEAILHDLSKLSQHVIATGGGVVLRATNRERLRAAGWVVWLTADSETIQRRLQGDATTWDRRPPLTTAPPHEEVAALLLVREPHYRSCAHVTVSTVARSPDLVAAEIVAAWESRIAAPT